MDDNIYFSFEIEERTLPFFIQTLGDKKLVWPSDYPHEKTREEFLGDLPAFFAREDIYSDSKRRILSENPKRLYKI